MLFGSFTSRHYSASIRMYKARVLISPKKITPIKTTYVCHINCNILLLFNSFSSNALLFLNQVFMFKSSNRRMRTIPISTGCLLWHHTWGKAGDSKTRSLIVRLITVTLPANSVMAEAILLCMVINNYDPNKLRKSKTYENPSRLSQLHFTIVQPYVIQY